MISTFTLCALLLSCNAATASINDKDSRGSDRRQRETARMRTTNQQNLLPVSELKQLRKEARAKKDPRPHTNKPYKQTN